MPTTGTVFKANSARGMFAIRVDDGFSVFERLGAEEFELGDVVSWAVNLPLGSTTVVNRTRSFQAEVYFQNHQVPAALLDVQLLLK